MEAVFGGAGERLGNDVIAKGLGRLGQNNALARQRAEDELALDLFHRVNAGNAEDDGAVLASLVHHAPDELKGDERPHRIVDDHQLRRPRSLGQGPRHGFLPGRTPGKQADRLRETLALDVLASALQVVGAQHEVNFLNHLRGDEFAQRVYENRYALE